MPEPEDKTQTLGTSQVDEAELNQIRAKSGMYDKLAREAEEYGFEGDNAVNEYIDSLTTAKFEEPPQPTKPAPTPAPEPKPVVPVKEPQTIDESALRKEITQLKEDVKQLGRMGSSSYLAAQHAEYQQHQGTLTDDKKSKATKRELTAVITGEKGQIITSIAPKFGNNMFRAADYLLSIEASLNKEKTPEEIAAQEALDKAADTATIPSGQAVPPDPDDTRTDLEKEADDICPDDESFAVDK